MEIRKKGTCSSRHCGVFAIQKLTKDAKWSSKFQEYELNILIVLIVKYTKLHTCFDIARQVAWISCEKGYNETEGRDKSFIVTNQHTYHAVDKYDTSPSHFNYDETGPNSPALSL